MKKPFRHLITGLCVILGASILLGIGTLWYLHTDHARTQILNALNRRITGTVSIQDLQFSLLSGRVEIWKLSIVDASLKEAAACEHLSIIFSWLPAAPGKASRSIRKHFKTKGHGSARC